ncbi:MAG: hypothetical protein ACLQHS_03925 [Candidatus Limnocylindrales bacterium]
MRAALSGRCSDPIDSAPEGGAAAGSVLVEASHRRRRGTAQSALAPFGRFRAGIRASFRWRLEPLELLNEPEEEVDVEASVRSEPPVPCPRFLASVRRAWALARASRA